MFNRIRISPLIVLTAVVVLNTTVGLPPALAQCELARLTASDGQAFDLFGWSVAVSGDTAVIGAAYDDSGTGSAYVFHFDGSNWVEEAKLLASDGAEADQFGYSVAISGDTTIIGASGDDGGKGSAYIFTPNDIDPNNWVQQAELWASDGAADDRFGYSVAISGDTAVIGAWKNDSNGSAYVFSFEDSTWDQKDKLRASDGRKDDWFGVSVAISGETAVIGAYGDDDNGDVSGSAYIFTPNDIDPNNWVQQVRLMAYEGAMSDWFGHSVAVSGTTALIGANNDDGYIGSAYIFAAYPGDLDADGDVDLVDFAILAGQWLQAPSPPCADIAPCEGNGVVNMWDLDVLCDHWLDGVSP